MLKDTMEVAEEQWDKHSSSARTLEALKKTLAQKPCRKRRLSRNVWATTTLTQNAFHQFSTLCWYSFSPAWISWLSFQTRRQDIALKCLECASSCVFLTLILSIWDLLGLKTVKDFFFFKFMCICIHKHKHTLCTCGCQRSISNVLLYPIPATLFFF